MGTPMLSDATKEAIRREVARYPQKKTALLPSLKLAQNEVGWLPPEVIAQVADLVGVPHSNATELATFYTMLHDEKVPPVRIEVCVQLPCALRGAEDTVRRLCQALDVEQHGHHGGVSRDGKIEVHGTVECFGACHRAPMARLGDAYREDLDDKNLLALVEEAKGLAKKAPLASGAK